MLLTKKKSKSENLSPNSVTIYHIILIFYLISKLNTRVKYVYANLLVTKKKLI